MPTKRINGVGLFYEVSGAGEPLVLVHGSWGDHHNWDPVVDGLSESFEVIAYDRRGHSASEPGAGQGSVYEDADDLAELIEAVASGPAHVVANSYGAIVALNAAVRRPEVFATLVAHEPPLVGMLAGTRFAPVLEELDRRVGKVVEALRAGETRNEDSQRLDLDALRWFGQPALLTKGTASPPFLIATVDAIAAAVPQFEVEAIEGADHAPHETTPERYVDVIRRFVADARAWAGAIG